jgi:hypothetical protein
MSGFSAGTALFKLAFQLSPIFLTNGIAANIPGGMLPIIAVTEAANFVLGLLSGGENIELDDFFAHFQPLPGSTLFSLEIGNYPFANQAIAANATIQTPLQLSMLMKCPVRNTLGYLAKLGTMIALQQVLAQHATSGGTYTICTPSYFYTNGILTSLRDASDAESHQVQNAYQWDFVFPLLTLQQAQTAQNNLMGQLTNQTQISGGTPSWSGTGPTVGNPASLAGPSLIPSQGSLPAISPASAAGVLS